MAVSVNLREVFSSDSQVNLSDKINFNFNQLLALGLGEPGPIGPIGLTGGIGPIGPIGPEGERGSKVFSTITIDSPPAQASLLSTSLDGDIYINTQKIFIKGTVVSGQWSEVVNFQSLITSQSLQDVFKVFQVGLETGDVSSKHAKLLRTAGQDSNNVGLATTHPMYYTGTPAYNTQLILSNFNEKKTFRIQNSAIVTNATTGDDSVFDYTALSKLVAYLPSSLTNYRHQLEIGSVDDLAITVGSNTEQYVITPVEQNLKLRKYRVSASTLTGAVYNRADFDLSGATANANSMNSEIVMSINKRGASTVNKIELALTNGEILGVRLPSAALLTDGLVISRDTSHISLGFLASASDTAVVNTTSNITKLQVKDTKITFASGNTTLEQLDNTKTIGLGTAVVVKNNRLTRGLPFPAVAVQSTDVNTLDVYEEGTWTPTLVYSEALVTGAANNAGSNLVINNASGYYVKIGQYVFVSFTIRVKYILDNGVALPTGGIGSSPLDLGYTNTNVYAVGSEKYAVRIGGLPFSPTGPSLFEVELKGAALSSPSLREVDLITTIDDGSTVTEAYIPGIVPGSVVGRAACFGSVNPVPLIGLYGHRYSGSYTAASTSRTNSVQSRVAIHDFLKVYESSSSTATIITGNGWLLNNGGACAIEEANEFGNGPAGGFVV